MVSSKEVTFSDASVALPRNNSLVTSTPAKILAVSEMPGKPGGNAVGCLRVFPQYGVVGTPWDTMISWGLDILIHEHAACLKRCLYKDSKSASPSSHTAFRYGSFEIVKGYDMLWQILRCSRSIHQELVPIQIIYAKSAPFLPYLKTALLVIQPSCLPCLMIICIVDRPTPDPTGQAKWETRGRSANVSGGKWSKCK